MRHEHTEKDRPPHPPPPARMSMIRSILARSLVKPFYRQHAGLLLFVFILFFGVISPSNQLTYHYHLILGMLNSPGLSGLVFLAWLIYAGKCMHFITGSIRNPDFSFLHMLNRLDPGTVYSQLLLIQLWIFLPVLVYALAIAGVAFSTTHYGAMLGVPLYASLLCLLSAGRYLHLLLHPGQKMASPHS